MGKAGEMPGWAVGVGVAFLTISLITLLVLLGVSFAPVKPTEYGLLYNRWTKSIDPEPFAQGRHFVGPSATFIRYPRILNTIEFKTEGFFSFDDDDENIKAIDVPTSPDAPALQVFSSDGQTVEIELSFQVRLLRDRLFDIYSNYGENWRPTVVHIAEQSVKDTTVNFLTLEFFSSRVEIRTKIFERLQRDLEPKGFRVEKIQLRNIAFNNEFENILQQKIVTAQQKRTTQNEQEKTVIEAGTRVVVANASQEILKINANATAEGFIITETARANGLLAVIRNETDVYKTFRDQLNITNDLLLEYLWTRYLSISEDTFLIGVKNIVLS